MTDTETAAAIAILRDAYPRQPFPDASVAFYTRKLRDLDGRELVEAVDRLTSRSSWLPSIAEIRREVAEARLGLPNVAEAWKIAERGSLRDAPPAVRETVEFVGGRWAILHHDNPATIRAQFRDQYNALREQALLKESGALPPRQLASARLALPEALEGPEPTLTLEVMAGPVMQRAARLFTHPWDDPDPPTEEEKYDAIRILERGPWNPANPLTDHVYRAAELVLVHATNAINEGCQP